MTKGKRSLYVYGAMILVFVALIYEIAQLGKRLQSSGVIESSEHEGWLDGWNIFTDALMLHVEGGFGLLLLQIIVILLCCRLFGWLFSLIGQPNVIGEIVAGIVLGPSVLGAIFPEFSLWLFRPDSLANINILSQFGLILFMFAIGMELDIEAVKKSLKETILISHFGTIFPFFLGMALAYLVYDKFSYDTTPFLSFALFIGISMSVTAFPVLARIIQEKGMTKSHLGTISLASAANGDITAWCILAVVIAIAQAGSVLSAVYNILFSILFMAFMFTAVRPFLRTIGQLY